MNREVQDQFRNVVQIYNYDKNIYRICFYGKHEVPGAPILIKENPLSIFKDPESKLQCRKKNFYFIYDPPTRNIRFNFENNLIFTGIINTKEDLNFLNLFLYDDLNIYGLGAINGNFNRNKGNFLLRNIDTYFYLLKDQPYASFPFLLLKRKNSNLHYAILQYTSYPLNIKIENNQKFPYKYEIKFYYYYKREVDSIDFFIFIGSLEEIISNYIKLTGYPFFPPIWSIGYHQSRWSYKTQETVIKIAKEARFHQIPLDAIYLDIHYMDKYKVFTWNKKNFPDPQKLVKDLNQLGIQLVAIVDPGIAIDTKYPVYNEGYNNNYFCKKTNKNTNEVNDKKFYIGKVWPGKVHFPDFTNEDVRKWWSKLNRELLNIGISGLWNDMNEPVLLIGKTSEPLKEDIYHEKGSHLKIRNVYALLEAEATYNAFLLHDSKKRPFVLTRSGMIGIQKWAALWTGDNHTSWEHLRENLYMVINLNLSGVFFCGADVGGFGAPRKGILSLVKVLRNSELFERWIELGSLLPLFRNHTILFSYDQEPWKYPKNTLMLVKKHIKRRYQLILYYYYLFYQAHTKGIPIIRPVFYEYNNLNIEDEALKNQFFVGSNLLSCPVLYPDVKKHHVYLPPGDWYEYETGKLYSGNRWVEFEIKRGYYPLFVKGGSILPILYPGRNTQETLNGELFLEVYPENNMEGNVYIDDGITNQYKEFYFLAQLKGERKSNNDILINYEIINNTYQPKQKNIKIRLPLSYKYVYINKKRKNALIRDLFHEDRKYSVSEFELPIEENWQAKFTMD